MIASHWSSTPIIGLWLARGDPAKRSPTLAAGHRKICGDLDALLPTSSCQGSLSILGILASHWSSSLYSWPLIGWWLVMHVSRPSWGPGWHPSPHYSAHVRQMTQNNPSSGQEKGSVPCTVHAVTLAFLQNWNFRLTLRAEQNIEYSSAVFFCTMRKHEYWNSFSLLFILLGTEGTDADRGHTNN